MNIFLNEIYTNYSLFELHDTAIILVTKDSTLEMRLSWLQANLDAEKKPQILPPIPILADQYSLFEIYFNSLAQGLGRKVYSYYVVFLLDKQSILRHMNYTNGEITPNINTLVELTQDVNNTFSEPKR